MIRRQGRMQPIGAAHSSGIGLVDTLLAVLIMAMLAAVPVIVFDADEYHLDATARLAVADMLEAQSLAIEAQTPFGLRFDSAANRYHFILETGQTAAQAESTLRSDPKLSRQLVDRLLEARAAGDPALAYGRLPAVVLDGGGNDLIFEVDGSPRTGGRVDIGLGAMLRRIRIQVGGGRIVITEP